MISYGPSLVPACRDIGVNYTSALITLFSRPKEMSKTDTSIPRLYSRHMIEPSLTTSPELVGILVELSGEPIFHRPEFDTTDQTSRR